jgi:hypothetical protein
VGVSDLDVLRTEHAEVGIGPLLAALLDRIVRSTAPQYPPSEYSPSGTWDRPALEDVLQDWVTTRLLERGDLGVLLTSARSVGALRALLTRSLAQHLTNRRRRTSATNLFTRMLATLRTDAAIHNVTAIGTVAEHGWTTAQASATSPAPPGTVTALVKAAGSRSDADLGVVRYGPYSLKSSPVLRGPALRSFLLYLLGEANGYLTTSELFHVMRHRFNLVELPAIEFDEAAANAVPAAPVTVETTALARSIVSRLSQQDAQLLRELSDHEGDAAAAEAATGSSVADLRGALERLHGLIADYVGTFDEAVGVHRAVIESLYGDR